jgi:hypothetical protein
LTRVYFSEDEVWPPIGTRKFTREEARHIAASVAKLPEFLRVGRGKES